MVTEASLEYVEKRRLQRLPGRIVLNTFGPERLMIGSDWPVCTLSGSYQDTMNIVIDYIAEQLSPDERADILGE